VRAIGRDGASVWSDTGFFTTQQAPVQTTSTTSKPPPVQTPTMTVSWTGTSPPRSQTTSSSTPADIQTTATQPTTTTPPSAIRQEPQDSLPDWVFYINGLGGIAIALLSFGIGLITARRKKINL
jgi:hypothetical protein